MTTIEKQPTAVHIPSEKELVDIVEGNQEVRDIQERHPDWPKLDVSFYFALHGNNKDTEGIAPHLAEADVLLYELTTPTEEGLKQATKIKQMYNKISTDPDRDVEFALKWGDFEGSSDEPLIRGVYGTGKAVGTLDIGATADERELVEGMNEAMYPMPQGISDYEDVLELFREGFGDFGHLQKQREVIMAEKFDEEIERILESRPDLMRKKNLKILVSMGSGHETLQNAFLNKGISSDRQSALSARYVKDYGGQLIEEMTNGQAPNDDLVKRAFTQKVLSNAIGKELKITDLSSEEYLSYLRHYVSELTDEEMESIFGLWNNKKTSTKDIDGVLVPAGLPPLAKSANEIIETNKWLNEQQHNLAETALKQTA